MAQQSRAIFTVALGDGAPTLTAGGTLERAFDGQNELAGLRQVSLEHAHVGDIERDRDERLLGHRGGSSVKHHTRSNRAADSAGAQPLYVGAFTGEPGEPNYIV